MSTREVNTLWNLITVSSKDRVVIHIKAKYFNYDILCDIFNEIQCYSDILLESILRSRCLPEYYKLIIPFLYNRYCTISKLLNSIDDIFEKISKEKLSRASKTWLLEILNKIVEEGTHNVLKNSNIILNEFRKRIPLFVIKIDNYNKIKRIGKSRNLIWQFRGFELADGNLDGSFGISTSSLLWIIINITKHVRLKFLSMYVRASSRDVTYEFLGIIPRRYAVDIQCWQKFLFNTYEKEGFNGLLEKNILPKQLDDWYRFFAGLFDGDGFIKVKHRYSIDVGLSFGRNLKGLIVSSIILYASTYLKLFDLGYFDKKSCKVYFRLGGRSLRFLGRVVGFLFHVDRRFKLERFLLARGLVVPG